MDAYISYNGLPVSAGGAHALNRNTKEVNYAKTLAFMERFAGVVHEHAIQLTLNGSTDKAYSTLKLVPGLSLKFGLPDTAHDGQVRMWRWNLKTRQVEKGFAALAVNDTLPVVPVGPLVLS